MQCVPTVRVGRLDVRDSLEHLVRVTAHDRRVIQNAERLAVVRLVCMRLRPASLPGTSVEMSRAACRSVSGRELGATGVLFPSVSILLII